MKDWRTHWQRLPVGCAEDDFLSQVGKTVDRQPISRKALDSIVISIAKNLEISPQDDVLDLCCGNGLLTALLAPHCRTITGLDYSPALIDIARRYQMRPNTSYRCADAMMAAVSLPGRFDKVIMYEALQHFSRNQFRVILDQVRQLSRTQVCFLAGSVPDRARIWEFYNTLPRKADYLWRRIRNREAIGHWWRREEIEVACSRVKLNVCFLAQPDGLHTNHYRFDALIRGV